MRCASVIRERRSSDGSRLEREERKRADATDQEREEESKEANRKEHTDKWKQHKKHVGKEMGT